MPQVTSLQSVDGKRIAEAREMLGKTIQWVSDKSRVSYHTLLRMEEGGSAHQEKKIRAVATVLKLSMDEITGKTQAEFVKPTPIIESDTVQFGEMILIDRWTWTNNSFNCVKLEISDYDSYGTFQFSLRVQVITEDNDIIYGSVRSRDYDDENLKTISIVVKFDTQCGQRLLNLKGIRPAISTYTFTLGNGAEVTHHYPNPLAQIGVGDGPSSNVNIYPYPPPETEKSGVSTDKCSVCKEFQSLSKRNQGVVFQLIDILVGKEAYLRETEEKINNLLMGGKV